MLSVPHIATKRNAGLPVALAYNNDINIDDNCMSDSPSPPACAANKYPSPTVGHRRMSEPAALSGSALYAPVEPPTRYTHFTHPHHHHHHHHHNQTNSNYAYNHPPRYYPSPLHRGCSTGSLRELRHHHSEWKHEDTPHQRHNLFDNRGDGFDEPISPLQPNFSGGLAPSPTSAMPYSPISENPYGPSPPGTGTSTSSSVPPLSAAPGIPCSQPISIPQHLQRSMSSPNISAEVVAPTVDRKTYSFVTLPGNAVKKRPRRRYDEIERLYQCSWPDCTKSYGTLNHLNAHVTMQKHGPKRTPEEFKDMRKQWRKLKKEQAAASLAMRRDSYGDPYDDPASYAHHYLGHQTSHPLNNVSRAHPVHDGVGLPSSVSIGSGDRYTSIPIDDIRYPPSNERDEGAGSGSGYETVVSRTRYPGTLPSSWHGATPSRSNFVPHQHQDSYGSSSAPEQQQQQQQQPHAHHHSQLPQLTISANIPRPLSPAPQSAPPHHHPHTHHHHHHHHHSAPHRGGGSGLPSNGAALLTTPLSTYHDSSSLLPAVQNAGGTPNLIFTSEGYEVYDSDSTGRPGTGHTNVSVS